MNPRQMFEPKSGGSSANVYHESRATSWSSDVAVDTAWVLITALIVFFMTAGFGCLEAGLCRKKNVVAVLVKTFVAFSITSFGFVLLGWTIMFSDGGILHPYFGSSGWLLQGPDNSPATDQLYNGVYWPLAWIGVPLFAKVFFQMSFACVSTCIVSGCVTERLSFRSYVLFISLYTCFLYPVVGHWLWGKGWLYDLGMLDFAGSSVVHCVGGWAGFAGTLAIGPRLGRFDSPPGAIKAIPAHNLPLAFLGGIILWLGWFGFNGGSTMGISNSRPGAVAHIFLNTDLSCSAALLTTMVLTWYRAGKPDFTMVINGALAGLVAITGPSAYVEPWAAFTIGMIAGILLTVAVPLIDRLRIDDPIGAISVHLISGLWGTFAVGLFATQSAPGPLVREGLFYGGGATLLGNQAVGAAAIGLFTFSTAFTIWHALRVTVGLRVSAHIEDAGLDNGEFGMEAYAIAE